MHKLRFLLTVFPALALGVVLPLSFASAATTTESLRPDGDVTTGWTQLGTDDASCALRSYGTARDK